MLMGLFGLIALAGTLLSLEQCIYNKGYDAAEQDNFIRIVQAGEEATEETVIVFADIDEELEEKNEEIASLRAHVKSLENNDMVISDNFCKWNDKLPWSELDS